MSTIAITAQPRSEFGKGAARRTRRAGLVPAVIYGVGTELAHISLPGHDLLKALRKPRVVLEVTLEGATYIVAPRDVQRDVVRQVIEHVDLVVLNKDEAKARNAEGAAIAAAEAAAEAEANGEAAPAEAVEASAEVTESE